MMEVLKLLSGLLLVSFLPPGLSEVVEQFSENNCVQFFLNGTTPNIPSILVDGKVNQNHYKLICQKYNNTYRFATLYDTTNRIPVFSAYKFTGTDGGKRPNQNWMIEPQLNGKENTSMKESGTVDEYNNQAGNKDYLNNIERMSRGHLFPNGHASDNDTRKSTFTLTNVVPQAESFNSGSWNTMETRVKNIMEQSCKDKYNKTEAYVVTGAVPSHNNTLNNRVNIPSLMWSAYCCKNPLSDTWISGAHWGANKNHSNTTSLPLADLNNKLSKIYDDKNVLLFSEECLATAAASIVG
ncbi:hypothetical protein DPEC_G00105700 [Dallia pectoralis]|uniref:Uncharacterized protein n=1 Tax=Dallia pectoralis TaxID=75939 RepID=A0ACC2GYC6_DALPE|nr:hypothetical protein DPEC_G00105700 [Dallia pectoralis]